MFKKLRCSRPVTVSCPTKRCRVKFGIAYQWVRTKPSDQQLDRYIQMIARSRKMQRGRSFDFVHIETEFRHQPNSIALVLLGCTV